MNIKQIRLKPTKEKSILRFHPWVFSGAIKEVDSDIIEGDIVEVISKVDIEGKELFSDEFIANYINNNILEINPDLK